MLYLVKQIGFFHYSINPNLSLFMFSVANISELMSMYVFQKVTDKIASAIIINTSIILYLLSNHFISKQMLITSMYVLVLGCFYLKVLEMHTV
jgi:hypothetical protein